MNGDKAGTQEPERLMDATEVAALLAVAVPTVWRLVQRDGFPTPIRFNRKLVRWKHSEVVQWLKEQR
jgi:predicted DNA-binding transcriptional regulator AlpA